MSHSQNFATMCVHVGSEPDKLTGAVVPPISLATTFAQNGLGQLHGLESSNSHERGFEYSRTGNPTRGAFERAIAAVEHAQYGIAFASGLVSNESKFSRDLHDGFLMQSSFIKGGDNCDHSNPRLY
jgi:cystathionine beta-lyase/cystathionine gamma-synthase